MVDNYNDNGNAGIHKYSDTNLIVNYLPPSLTDPDFKAMFESIGTVTASRIIRDRTTGLSYGYGFVDFANPDHARKAIEALDGMQLQNKRLKVSLSRQGDDVRASNLYISNLPKFIAEVDLQNLFQQYGTIIQTKILMDPATGTSRGVGFVRFSTREEAQKAMELTNGSKPVGFSNPMAVKFAEDNREKAKKIQQAILGGSMGQQPGGFPTNGPAGFPAQPLGMRPQMGNMNGAGMGPGCNQFGMGYQGDLGGGPMRGGQPRQRFDPMGFGGGAMNGFNGMTGMVESTAGYPLFVYNIGLEADERALFQLFSPFGALQKVTVVRDSEGKSKGFAFVTMVHMHEAQNAIKNLNGMLYNEKRLQVSLKQAKGTQQVPQQPMGGMGGSMGPQTPMQAGGADPMMGSQGGSMKVDGDGSAEGHVLFVYNIGLEADERLLWQLFQPFGPILKVHISRAQDTRKCKGFGFVTMSRYQDAQSAIQSLNGIPYLGRMLQVSFKQSGIGKSAGMASSTASNAGDFKPTANDSTNGFGGGYGNGMGNYGGNVAGSGNAMGNYGGNVNGMGAYGNSSTLIGAAYGGGSMGNYGGNASGMGTYGASAGSAMGAYGSSMGSGNQGGQFGNFMSM